MPLDSNRTSTKEAAADTFTLKLNLEEAQDLFDLIGDLILPKKRRKKILKVYKQFLNDGFIDDDF